MKCIRKFFRILDWMNSSFTTSIESYEKILGQDIDGDGAVGIDITDH